MKSISLVILALLSILLMDSSRTQKEQLIIFRQNTESTVIVDFHVKMMDDIKAIAKKQNLDIIIADIEDGAPKEVTYTPFIAFRNKEGVSLFYGRWNQASKLENFIRTSRIFKQSDAATLKEDILEFKSGRTKVLMPIKITEMTGTPPKDYNYESFKKEVKEYADEGTLKFKQVPQSALGKNTRAFYTAIYVNHDEKCNYAVTSEIYSQFNCETPIYTSFDNPVVSKKLGKAVKEVALNLEAEIFRQMRNPDNGDGFDAIPSKWQEVTWADIGGELDGPVLENVDEGEPQKFIAKEKWTTNLNVREGDDPFGLFRFMAPLDNYTGELKSMKGNAVLQPGSISGAFTVPVSAITMGDKDLDDAISSFILKGDEMFLGFSWKQAGLKDNLSSGMPVDFKIPARLKLNEKEKSVDVEGRLVPQGEQLQVSASFSIDKSIFGVEKGPDGPEETKELMEFFLRFNLK